MDKFKRNIKPFDGEKYSVWKIRMRALLVELNLISVVDEITPNDPDRRWLRDERRAKNIIVEYLSDSFLGFASDECSSKDIFMKLDALYERKSLATQLAIRKKLLNLKLSGDTNLVKHFMTFDNLICDLLSAGAKLEEMDKVSHLLLTLPSSYDGVVTAIETLSEDSLTLAFVKTRLLDQELKLNEANKDTSAKVLNTELKYNMSHPINKYKKFKRNYNFNDKNRKCLHCGKKGHLIKNCYKYKKQYTNNNENNGNKYAKNNKSIQTAEKDPMTFAFMANRNINANADDVIFVLDSGASDHFIKDDAYFEVYEDIQPSIRVSIAKQNTFIEATKRGTIKLSTDDGLVIVLKEVLFCKEVPNNLLSVSKIRKSGFSIVFDPESIKILKGNNVILEGNYENNVSKVKLNLSKAIYYAGNDEYLLWHERLGHIGRAKFDEIKYKQMFSDVELLKNVFPNNDLCEPCIKGKQSRLPYQKAKDKTHIVRELFIVHSDVCGPIMPPTLNEKNYFVIYVDQYTHYCVTYLISRKSDVFSTFQDYVQKSAAHFNLKIANLYIDNGREYLSNEMKDFCMKQGISYHLTVPHSPQQNGVSERMIRTITEKARALVHGANLDKTFWGEAVLTATFLINICPSRAIKESKTPWELWHKRKPVLKHLKVFGATVYVHNKVRTDKFQERAWKGILVGYEPNGYKVWDVENGKFVLARDVTVDEKSYMVSRPISQLKRVRLEDSNGEQTVPEIMARDSDKIHESEMRPRDNRNDYVPSGAPDESESNSDNANSPSENIGLEKERDASPLRRSKRLKLKTPISYNYDNENFSLCALAEINDIPSSYAEIRDRSDRMHWENAIKDELESHIKNQTWSIVTKPTDRNLVDSRWVFTIKRDELGNIIKYKARLVARGLTQEYLVDFSETFAPVAKITSFRFLIAFANQNNLLVHHMDVKTAFLNGKLEQEIYMRLPEGLAQEIGKVCKLNKAIYGLKQAARCWFNKFDKTLKEIGFINSSADRCIYLMDKGCISKNIYLVLYVDDVVVVTKEEDILESFKQYLKSKFEMSDLGEIKYFVGIRIERDYDTIKLSQSAYIKNVLKKFSMSECKPVNSPLPNNLNYDALNSDNKIDAPCRNLLGCLMYIMLCTRPDLNAAVNILSRYTNNNNAELWQSLKRILRYLKASADLRLVYKRSDDLTILIGYADSDWGGGDNKNRKSTTGYLFKMFGVCTICWNTRRQSSVAASSTEAEYMALFEAVREAMWLKSLASSIHININQAIKIFEDNIGCISIAENPTCHRRSKHIEIKYHFTREKIENNLIILEYIPTGKQLADGLTKPLSTEKFLKFRNEIGLN